MMCKVITFFNIDVEKIWNKPGTDPEENWKNLFILNKSHFS